MELTRRNFLSGVAVAGMGLAGAGLAGCAPSAENTLAATGASDVDEAASQGEAADWLGPEPVIDETDVTAEEDCDVLVIGLGNAGCMAYRAAAEAGAKVIAVEKSSAYNATGGAFALIGGALSERWGRPDIDPEEIINRHMSECGYYVKRSIISRYVYEVSDVFDWIIEPVEDLYIADDSMADIPDGCECNLVPDTCLLPKGYDYREEILPTFPTSVGFGNLGLILGPQIAAAEATGNATALYGHYAEKLIKEGSRVVGAYVRNGEDGTYRKINAAKGVVLATGDYSSNTSMLQAFAPETIENGVPAMWIHTDTEGNNTNRGDGHRMGTWAGARMQRHHAPMIHHMGGGADISGQGVMGINGYLNLNLEGKRFMNEDAPGQQIENQIEMQPQRTTYQFFDAKWPEQCGSFPPGHGNVNFCLGADEFPKNNAGAAFCVRTPESVEEAVAAGTCFKADTIEELLAQLEGMDVETAKTSIERYNELCHAGSDVDFGKDSRRLFALENPPFYACAFTPAIMLVCVGGLESDENCHVYDEERAVIEGLYACGNVQGDRFAMAYPIALKGLSVGMAQFYGYIAGTNAAMGA